MNRRVRRNVNNLGQAVTETFLLLLVIVGIASFVWLFHQGYVGGNLYGFKDSTLGIEQVVSRDYP